ncbi:hypothetical protein U472_00265 [Orenia metallireducens]|jgi:predicted nucleic acid-binding protein|uniref:Uncharacterized protein n=1 Tax=Orenia metallireducens TaxID=1413210 RepID=A0A1C0ADA8_9FIRM|nr:hypothetical protein [Orenia metallireducens]OCL28625.1 hypothetical protein U472_00265 [Orenia metallireducens]
MDRNILLAGRISDKSMNKKDVDFVEGRLKQGVSKSELVQNAISVYRKYLDGELLKDEVNNIVEAIKSNNIKIENDDKPKEKKQDNELLDKIKSKKDAGFF